MMKTKLMLISLISTLTICVNAQTDVTSKYLTNADFSNGTFVNNAPTGWTLELTSGGVQSKISTAEKSGGVIAGNQNHWQLWQSSGALTGKAYQKAIGLPPGRYKLTAIVSPSFGGGTMELYMNNATTSIATGQAKVYEVEAMVADGRVELGLKLNTTNGATIDFDSFLLYLLPSDDDELSVILETWHEQCVSDTLAKNRQQWYNRDEMLTAFAAYDEAQGNETKMEIAIDKLKTAHNQYTEITTAYASLRDEATKLNSETNKSKFALRDTIRDIRTKIISYYSKNEDHYAWVCEALSVVRSLSTLFGGYKHMNLTISTARNQLKATDYNGKSDLQAALSEANGVLAAATTMEEFQQGITFVKTAQANYLKNRPSEWVTIQNGQLWKTKTGTTVQAHAPGFVRVGDIWYMCGEDRSSQWNPDVNLYSSTDLRTWKLEKKIIQNGVTTSELGSSRMIERPKLLYNAMTNKYLVWCHYESGNYGASEAACFECDSVNGAYQYVWSGRPMNVKSRDCNVFQDTNGTAYFISTTEENQHLGLFKLSDDYHEAIEHTQLFSWQSREAPAIVKLPNSRYFMFNSACSGWDPNQCKWSSTTNIKSGWSGLTNVGNSIAYDTQAAAILEIKGTKTTTYLYVGDRWQDPGLPESKTIIFPVSFLNNSTPYFDYRERFDINFVTGEWRETPTDDIFADKSQWKIIDKSSEESGSGNATNAIDGRVNTMWHTQYSGTVAEAPHHIAIDMGKSQTIKGFLATPRMDGNTNGLIRKYQFLVSADGSKWTSVSSGDWLPYWTEVDFSKRECRYIKLICKEDTWASLAELDVILDPVYTAIEAVSTDGAESAVVRRDYYSLDGRLMAGPVRGVYIERIHYEDGVIRSVKKWGK